MYPAEKMTIIQTPGFFVELPPDVQEWYSHESVKQGKPVAELLKEAAIQVSHPLASLAAQPTPKKKAKKARR